MFSAAMLNFFVSEPSKVAKDLRDFVEQKLTFKSSSGTIRLHLGYLQVSSLPRLRRSVQSSP